MFFGLLLFETVVRRRAGLLEVHFALQYPVQVLDNEFGRMWYKKDLKFHMPKGKQTGSSPITISCVKHVLNWANFCFTNLVGSICWTVMKLCSGSKKLYSSCSGNFTQFGEHCLWLVESKVSSPVDEEEGKMKMDDRVITSLALEGTDLFVDL